MSCSLVGPSEGGLPAGPLGTALAGTLVSSLHRLKDTDNSDGAFFIFGDLSIKLEGSFRLQFNLYEMRDKECFHVQSVQSEAFTVHPSKSFPGMSESTFLTRSFSDQGVRLRLRKEPRTLLKRRGPASDDYQPRQYRTSHNRQQSHGRDRLGPESQDLSRPAQVEQGESMQLPIHSQSYEPRPPLGRGYSHQSSVSISGSYSDEGPNKRPRTGSEQSSTYSHQALDSPQYPGRMFSDSGFGASFSQQAAHQQAYGYTYVQSPQSSSMSSREHYFAQRLNTQAGNSPSFEPSSQRSPQSAYFPAHQQGMRYQQPPLMGASPPQRIQSAQNTFEGLGITTRTQMSPGMQPPGIPGMAPPTYGRMNTNTGYGALAASPVGRREMYEQYPPSNQTLSASTIAPNLMVSRGPPITTTTAPGNLEGSF